MKRDFNALPVSAPAERSAPTKSRAQSWIFYGAIFGGVGCFVFPLVGALLLHIESQPGGSNELLRATGSALAFSSLPLLIVGAICLDRLEKEHLPRRAELRLAQFAKRRALRRGRRQEEARAKQSKPARGRRALIGGALTALALISLASLSEVYAQQTIFNVPSSDVLDRGKVYGELDATFRFNDSDILNRFSSFVPRVVVGVGGRTEVERLRAENTSAPIPVDLVTTSASGLDPHISPAAAEFQIPRVARERGQSEDAIRQFVRAHTAGRQLGFLGEPTVNVLELNLDLNDRFGTPPPAAAP